MIKYLAEKNQNVFVFTENLFFYNAISFIFKNKKVVQVSDIKRKIKNEFHTSILIIDSCWGIWCEFYSVILKKYNPEVIIIFSSFNISKLKDSPPVVFFDESKYVLDFIRFLNSGENYNDGFLIKLSKKEFEILIDIFHSVKIIDISKRQNISIKTVYEHKKNIMKRLNVKNEFELVNHPVCKRLLQS